MPTSLRADVQEALAPAYWLERPIGHGGAAVVYLAQDRKHDRPVAIKMLDAGPGAAAATERFLREIRLAARLTHPHIVPVHDSGAVGGSLYFVMPYIPGESLRARLEREGALPVPDALRIAADVAAALAYAHRAGVVHRDVKPENVLLHEGEALVADFGIARALSGAGSERLTRTGRAIGTPAYFSPEQASGEPEVDGRTDVFSLGCVVYEMLAGSPPFTGPTTESVIARRFLGPPPPVRERRPDVPTWVADALARALAESPRDRSSAEEFAAELTAGWARVWAAAAGDGDAPGGPRPAIAVPDRPASAAVVAAHGTVSYERPQSPAPGAAGAPRAQRPRAVAVLPFADLSAVREGRDGEYFGDGMAEEVINALAYVAELHVASRTSAFAYKGASRDVRRIGAELGVDLVLEGSVRRSGSRLRVSAQLVDVRTGYQRWAARYDRDLDDVFAIQDELARTIVGALQPELLDRAPGDFVKRSTANPRAYDLYLRGRHRLTHLTAGGLGEVIALFEAALAEDPALAPAHAALASTCVAYAFFGEGAHEPTALWRRARDAATTALRLDGALADAQGALGTTKWACEWDFVGAERDLRRAVELKAGDPALHNWHGWALLLLGRFDEALPALERARELDPLAPWLHRSVARALYLDRQYERAAAACRRALAWAPQYALFYGDLAAVHLAEGRPADALTALAEGRALRPDDVRALSLSGCAHAALGDRARAAAALDALLEQARRRYVTPLDTAVVRLALGDVDGTVADLEAAYAARDVWLPWARWLPLLDGARGDPRFARVLDRVGAPAVARASGAGATHTTSTATARTALLP